jgi:hypothetical protein
LSHGAAAVLRGGIEAEVEAAALVPPDGRDASPPGLFCGGGAAGFASAASGFDGLPNHLMLLNADERLLRSPDMMLIHFRSAWSGHATSMERAFAKE